MKTKLLLLKTACLLLLSLNVSAQCPVTANAGSDVTICPGGSTQLNASGGAFYSWSPTTGLSNPVIANPVASPGSTTNYTVTVSSPSGELVTNGNFESGSTGFTSQYTNVTGFLWNGNTNSGLYPEGTFAIVTDPAPYHPAFTGSHNDHTTGSGYFMAVNGARADQNIPLVWQQTVPVIPNTLYFFSTWITSIHPASPATVNFSIVINGNPIILGPNIQAPPVGQWVQFYAEWTSPPGVTSADIKIVDLNPEPSGNDFGLDDISFTTVCSSTDQVTVNVSNPSASITAGGPTTFCDGGGVTLTANSGSSYLWHPGNQTTPSINVTASGSYTVTVTNADNCSATSAPVNVTVNPNPTPTISANGPTTFCAGGSVTLTSNYAGNVWSPNGETTQSIVVSASGSYSVTVTDGNGCSGTSATTTVTVNPNPTPTVSASGPLTFCAGGSVTLTSSSATGNVWSPNGETTQSIVVSASGSYSVTVTDGNGCSGTSAPTTVTVNPNPTPTVSANGPTTFCAGGSVTLTSSSATGNVWSPNGETTQSIVVSASGSYGVTVTDGNGCSGTSAPTTVTVNPNPTPTISANGPTTFCAGGSVTLTSSSATGNVWSPNGETTQSIVVSASGSYSVTVTDGNGCSGASAPTTVTVNPNQIPTVSANGPLTFCAGGSVTLTSSSATGNVWSPNGETTQSIVVSASGSYSVTVTDGNGCSGTSAPTDVTVNPNPTPTVSANGPLTFCAGGSVTLSSSSATSNVWAPNGETTQSIVVSASGSYSVTVTGGNGCTGTSAPTDVTVNPNPTPTVSANGPLTFCNGGSVTLTSSYASGNVWSPNGETGASIVVSASGSYSVTVTDGNGCSGTSAPTDVTVNPNPTPTVSANGPLTFCAGGSVTLSSSSATGNVWAPNGETTQSIVVSASGSYSVTVIDGNGCSGTSAPTTVTVNPNPTPTISANGPLTFCAGGSVTLTSSSATGNVWSPNGETTESIVVSASGSYSVTVTDGNGCTGTSAPTDVTVNPNPTPTVSANGPTTFCAGGSVTLTSSSATGNVWSPNGETTESIVVSASGSFSVTVTDGNGCTGTSAPTVVTVNPNPTPTISASGPLTFCSGGSVTLTSSSASGNVWSPNGETTQSIVVSASGSYSVTVIDGNGCSGTSAPTTVTVNPNPTPTITASGPLAFCSGGSVTLTANSSASYLWSTGATTQSITVTATGNYTVTETNAYGCSATSAPTTVTVYPIPNATVTPAGPLTICSNGTVTLTANSGSGYSYSWSPGGQTTQSITVSQGGNYKVKVTGPGGCYSWSNIVCVTVRPSPTAIISASCSLNFCQGGSATLTANSGYGYTYLWSNGATTHSIIVTTGGNYTVTVTNSYGCSATSAPKTVTVSTPPPATITANGPLTFCSGGNVTLTANAGSGYTYLWSSGQTTQSITVSQGGNYRVRVTNSAGCSTWSNYVTTSTYSGPNINLGPDRVIYYGYGTQSTTIVPTISGGLAPYTVTWSPSNTVTATSSNAGTTITVYATVTDARGCTRTDAVRVCIADVRCGNNNAKVLIWHYPPGNCGNPQLLCVAASAVPAHLAHGDHLYSGNCNCGYGKLGLAADATEEFNESSALVFPNPFAETLNFDIHVPANTAVKIYVFDDKGSLVAMPFDNTVSGEMNFAWDASQLASGIYFAKIITDEQVFTQKLTK